MMEFYVAERCEVGCGEFRTEGEGAEGLRVVDATDARRDWVILTTDLPCF